MSKIILSKLNTSFNKLTKELKIKKDQKNKLVKIRNFYSDLPKYDSDWKNFDFKGTENFKDFILYVEHAYYKMLAHYEYNMDVKNIVSQLQVDFHISFLVYINEYLKNIIDNQLTFTEDHLKEIEEIDYNNLLKLNYLFDKKITTNFFEHVELENNKEIKELKKEHAILSDKIKFTKEDLEENFVNLIGDILNKDTDYSKNSIVERMILLDKLGVIKYLDDLAKSKGFSQNQLALIISYFVGSKQTTIQPLLRGISNKKSDKNPYYTDDKKDSIGLIKVNEFIKEFPRLFSTTS